jgi:hypothetical protein
MGRSSELDIIYRGSASIMHAHLLFLYLKGKKMIAHQVQVLQLQARDPNVGLNFHMKTFILQIFLATLLVSTGK